VAPEESDLAMMQDPGEDAYAYLSMSVARLIELGLVRAEFQDIQLMSQTLWAAVHGAASLHITHVDCPWVGLVSLRRRIDAIVNCTLDGMLGGMLATPQSPSKSKRVVRK